MSLVGAVLVLMPVSAKALDPEVLNSVVRIKPNWPLSARGQNADGAPRDPQGTGVAILEGGYISTNVHVIGKAAAVDVLTEDGRILPAIIVGRDFATDIALLKVNVDLPVMKTASPPALAAPVCAIGNQFGLGLSVTCGVVSAISRNSTGFNPIEDFIQTDASINPGGSGGALVDSQSRLIGLVSAIFTKQSDADIGVNFATSTRLLMRVVEDLKEHGRVILGVAGFDASVVPPRLLSRYAGVMVSKVDVQEPAFLAGLEAGDIITHIGGNRIPSQQAFNAEMFIRRPGELIVFEVRRGDMVLDIEVTLN
ncbi:trypsin-like peptidase domain-containing protein [Rhodospirillales bacterium]|nr:trypsin-like peptidase domain-containing protein [Rhodospirillales bacterium]